MAGGLDITISLGDELERALGRAIEKGDDLTRPMAAIAEALEVGAHQHFETESDPMGVPWKPRRDNSDPGRKILSLSRALEQAIVREFGRDFAQVGVLRTAGPARYARIHNEGGTIRPKHKKALSFAGRLVAKVVMPKRQYLGWGNFEREETIDILTDHLRHLFDEGAAA
ncbi:phage virion morphogenesis protein [Sphingobium aquiterrae]|uniref:phage virion morphogenesis protein n=1 Tax=Sphingobium aquiterrae TaxID=2038656 RepID=UPI003019EDC8